MEQNENYMSSLEHAQEYYAEDYSEWLKEKSLTASEETADLFLEEVEQYLDEPSEELPL